MVVESRTLLGVGVRDVLDREDDIEVVAQMQSPAEAISVVGETAPDVILVNLPSDLPAAAEIARQLRQETPNSALVVMGGEDDDASIVEALEVGAVAHVAELAQPAELIAIIRRVAEGDDPLKDEISGRRDLVERIVDIVRQSIDQEHLRLATPRRGQGGLEPLELGCAADEHVIPTSSRRASVPHG
jgi:two-component system NarL family response regulator